LPDARAGARHHQTGTVLFGLPPTTKCFCGPHWLVASLPIFLPIIQTRIGAVLSTLAFLRRLAIRLLATFYGNGVARMILVSDAVAEVDRTTHEAELQTMARLFADVKPTDEVIGMLDSIKS